MRTLLVFRHLFEFIFKWQIIEFDQKSLGVGYGGCTRKRLRLLQLVLLEFEVAVKNKLSTT
jgi:hypothetical protein